MANDASEIPFGITHKLRTGNPTHFLLIRHPFDVTVSLYHHRHDRYHVDRVGRYHGPLSEFIEEWFADKILNTYRSFYRKREFIHGWARYEDMVIDPSRTLTQFLTYLGETDFSRVEAAVAKNSFSRLQAAEVHYTGDARKFRVGKIGGYRDEVSPSSLDFMRAVLHKYDPKEVWGYV
jgi:hypothetical protein